MSQERRLNGKDIYSYWDTLNDEQKFAVTELQCYGYELLFVRGITQQPLAILAHGDQLASVDCLGQIDTAPQLRLRN